MSGGHFDYYQYRTAETFENRWQDEELNQLFEDLFIRGFGHRDGGLVCSLDLYLSGDIEEESYREEVQAFKDKWFGRTPEDRVEFYAEKLQEHCNRYKKELGE